MEDILQPLPHYFTSEGKQEGSFEDNLNNFKEVHELTYRLDMAVL